MRRFFRTLTAILALLLALSPGQAWSYSTLLVPESGSLFWLDILDEGDVIQYETGEEYAASEFTLNLSERQALRQGLEYWRLVLQEGARNTAPLGIFVETRDRYDDNASAQSFTLKLGDAAGKTWLAGALADNWFGMSGTDWLTSLALITIDRSLAKAGWYTGAMPSLPQNGNQSDLPSTLLHEMTHALGMSATAWNGSFGSTLALWDKGLRDINGKAPEPGMELGTKDTHTEGAFETASLTAYSGLYFTGDHVKEVLQDAWLTFPEPPDPNRANYTTPVPGLPINGWEPYEEEGKLYWSSDFSHIELQNGLMSHQAYRNWTTLMEAELAAMQDCGLTLDRRVWFGYSIYNSGITFTNNHPYYARENGEWLYGKPSTTPWGIGLHVYGSNNTITQAADLLADGAYAIGIRVDGQNNALTVARDTRVQANGPGGTALLVSYGMGHSVRLDGSAIALGEGGIAARFDFGDNEMGNYWEYRGSWMRTTGMANPDDFYSDEHYKYVEHANLPEELKGALVTNFNVTGLLAGEEAAIHIADNALVEKINILSGAQIYGDIVSEWYPKDPRIQTDDPDFNLQPDELYTLLTFGQKKTVQRQTGDGFADDPDFSMTLYGNIVDTEYGIRMSHRAGRLEVLGTVQVAELENHGTLALYGVNEEGNAVTTKNFVNADGATLEAGFAADESVTTVRTSYADLSGTLALRPMADFYASNHTISLKNPLQIQEPNGNDFDGVTVTLANSSPTLSFDLANKDLNSLQVDVSRPKTAYSQYAQNSGASALGRSLASIGTRASGDMRTLFTALDWSAPDGREVGSALDTLGPEAYDASARVSLAQQSEFNLLILRRMLANESARRFLAASDRQADADNWQVWATPYGSGSWQGSHGGTSSWSSTGIGLLVGADRYFESGLSLGAHVAVAARRTHVKDNHDAQIDTKSAFVGLQALLAPSSWDGFWLTAQGRLGIESGEMDREVSFNGYTRLNESRWSGFAGGALLGGGKDWFFDASETSQLVAGPLAFFEYSFLQRPGIDERNGQASRLSVDDTVYESLLMNLGAHAGWTTKFENGASIGLDLLAAWRHELLDATFRTGASFRGYGDYGFESATDLPGRDSLLVQGSLRFRHPTSSFFAQIDFGGEFFREDYTSLQAGLQLGWEF